MGHGFGVTYDAAEPEALAAFWALALGYIIEPPPKGFDSWEAALEDWGVPREVWHDYSAVVDPAGEGPRVFFQRVPEPKTAKNRVHLDVHAPGGKGADREAKLAAIRAHVATLEAAGAVVQREFDEPGQGFWIVMADPEGNEFCVV